MVKYNKIDKLGFIAQFEYADPRLHLMREVARLVRDGGREPYLK